MGERSTGNGTPKSILFTFSGTFIYMFGNYQWYIKVIFLLLCFFVILSSIVIIVKHFYIETWQLVHA